jgi:hypothetical protein
MKFIAIGSQDIEPVLLGMEVAMLLSKPIGFKIYPIRVSTSTSF